MNKSLKTTKGALCSLASVLSSGALMVSNVSAININYYSGNPDKNDDNGTKVLTKKIAEWDNWSYTFKNGDTAYRGLYNIGSVAGVLDEEGAENTATFEDIIKQGYDFSAWNVGGYYGLKNAGAQFQYEYWNQGDLNAVAQWTDLKKAVFANGATERMVVGTPFEVMDGEVKIGEISLSYKVNTTRGAEDATETTPLAVTSIDEEIAFTVDDEHGYELKKVDVQIGEAEAVDMIADVEGGKLVLEDVKEDVDLDVEMGLKEFTVTANVTDEEHAHVEPVVDGKITYGQPAVFNVVVEKGYEVLGVRESGDTTDYEIVDGKLAIENVTSDMSFAIVVEPEEYTVMEGEGQVFDAAKGEDLVFRFSGEDSLFDSLYIDDELVDEENYTHELGSTIVALAHDFVANNYAEGTHEVVAVYKNGTTVETTFEIPAPKTPDTGANSKLSASTIASVLACAATGSVLALIMLGIKRKMNR